MGSTSTGVVLLLIHILSIFAVIIFKVDSYSSFPVNITIGSSISTLPNKTSYWLSPSTNFAFGFYPISSEHHQYRIGIWLTRTNATTLVWSADRDNFPLSGVSQTVLFDHDGVFKVQSSGISNPLFNLSKSASYGLMQDDGNFALYDTGSRVLWQSFDHPTNTILAGQVLRPGQSLVSSILIGLEKHYQLTLQQDGDIVICNVGEGNKLVWDSRTGIRTRLNAVPGNQNSGYQLSLDSAGRLYLADSVIIKNFTDGEKTSTDMNRSMLYRATLNSDGSFCLYRERFGVQSDEPDLIWHTILTVEPWDNTAKLRGLGVFLLVFIGLILMLVCIKRHTAMVATARGFFSPATDHD